MTTPQKLEAITQRIAEVVPGVQTVKFQEILLCLSDIDDYTSYSIDGRGHIIWASGDNGDTYTGYSEHAWVWDKPFNKQSPELIDWLYNLLFPSRH